MIPEFSFTEILRELEAELSEKYWPGAIRWADENHDNAWTKAIDRFDAVLSDSLKVANPYRVKNEAQIYRKTLLDLLQKYKVAHETNEAFSFLETLRPMTRGESA